MLMAHMVLCGMSGNNDVAKANIYDSAAEGNRYDVVAKDKHM